MHSCVRCQKTGTQRPCHNAWLRYYMVRGEIDKKAAAIKATVDHVARGDRGWVVTRNSA